MAKQTQQEIDKLWDYIKMSQARTEALQTMVIACMACVEDRQKLGRVVQTAREAMLSDRLGRAVDDAYIAEFVRHLDSLTPPDLPRT
jgi:hypothetical protein